MVTSAIVDLPGLSAVSAAIVPATPRLLFILVAPSYVPMSIRLLSKTRFSPDLDIGPRFTCYAASQLAFFSHLFADSVRGRAGHLVLTRFLIFGFAGQELDGIGGKRAFELLVAGHD